MSTEPFDLSAYLRVKRGVERDLRRRYPGELERLPEAERGPFLKAEVRRIWDILQESHRQYREHRGVR